VPDSIRERLLFLRKVVEGSKEVPDRHSPLMLLDPTDHSSKRLSRGEIANPDNLRGLITGNEHAALLCGVLEEHVIAGPLWKDIDGALDVPSLSDEPFDNSAWDVLVCEEGETRSHYRFERLRKYSSRSRSLLAAHF